MNQKTEWEVVDHPTGGRRPTMQDLMKSVFGPHWRWKVAGMAVIAGLFLTAGIVMAGIFFVGVAVVALALLITAQCRYWLTRARNAYHLHSGAGRAAPAEYREVHDHDRTRPR
jgi:hypothetical protein